MTRLRAILSYLWMLWRPSLRLERSPERLLMPMIMATLTVLAVLAASLPLKISAGGAFAARGVEGHLVVHLAKGDTSDQVFEDQLAALISRLEENEAIARVSVATGPDLAETLGVLFGNIDQVDHLYGGIVRLDLVEVTGRDANIENLQFAVRDFSSANVDDFRIWKEAGAEQTRQALMGGLFILAISLILVAAILNLTLRLGLRVHQRTLRVIHHLGATDAFAAMIFQATTFQRALVGTAAGALLAFGILSLLRVVLQSQGYIGASLIGPGQIAALIVMPLIQIIWAVFIARQTALSVLKKTY